MGQIFQPLPVFPLVAAFSRHAQALLWARRQFQQHWGPIALESEAFAFVETAYYQASMGPELRKQFWLLAEPIDPLRLVEFKETSNRWEEQFAAAAASGGEIVPGDPPCGAIQEPRPLNIDPGYLTLAKLVLASTKDHAHRLYLARGIYAEVTLQYRHQAWQPLDWTFPDYRRADYHAFFHRCRDWIKRRAAAS